jgi:hypothetical protein
MIKIGKSPDYAMRLGKMDVYHKANIYVFSRERKFMKSAVKSDRSIQAVAVSVREFLRHPSFISIDSDRPLPIARRVVLRTRTGFAMIRLRLPVTIAKDKFEEICEQFWEVIFPGHKHQPNN